MFNEGDLVDFIGERIIKPTFPSVGWLDARSGPTWPGHHWRQSAT